MKMMKNAIVAQSGGPTTAINASLAGVIKGCLESHEIDVLYGALNGVEGLMDERLVNLTDIFDHNEENLNVLKLTPAMYLGSCRRKLKDVDQDSSEYDIIINIGIMGHFKNRCCHITCGRTKSRRMVSHHQIIINGLRNADNFHIHLVFLHIPAHLAYRIHRIITSYIEEIMNMIFAENIDNNVIFT